MPRRSASGFGAGVLIPPAVEDSSGSSPVDWDGIPTAFGTFELTKLLGFEFLDVLIKFDLLVTRDRGVVFEIMIFQVLENLHSTDSRVFCLLNLVLD